MSDSRKNKDSRFYTRFRYSDSLDLLTVGVGFVETFKSKDGIDYYFERYLEDISEYVFNKDNPIMRCIYQANKDTYSLIMLIERCLSHIFSHSTRNIYRFVTGEATNFTSDKIVMLIDEELKNIDSPSYMEINYGITYECFTMTVTALYMKLVSILAESDFVPTVATKHCMKDFETISIQLANAGRGHICFHIEIMTEGV